MGFDINRLIWFADEHASDGKVLLFLLLQLLMGALMIAIALRFGELSHGMLPLDVAFFYGPETARRFLAEIPAGAVLYYRQVIFSADLVYLLLYSFSYALIVVWLMKKLALRGRLFPQGLVLFPFAVGLLDLLENIGVLAMLQLNPAVPQALVLASSLVSAMKWLGAFAGLGMLIYMLFKLITARPERFGRLS